MDYLKVYNELYIKRRMSLTQIGEFLGTHRETVARNFRKLGLSINRHTIFDYTGFREDAFDIWTPEMAYWLGFFAADASVSDSSSSISVILKAVDKQHLEKLRKFLCLPEYCLSTKERLSKGKPIVESRLIFTSAKMKSSLERLGVIPRKTYFDIDFLSYVPDDFKLFFLFGYFDGDGSFASKGITDPRVFYLGSFSFMQSVKSFFQSKYGFNHVDIVPSRMRYSVSWSSFKDVFNFATMYLNLLGDLSLDRKRFEALQIVDLSSKRVCTNCGVIITLSGKTGLCSNCQKFSTRKVTRPSKDELAILMQQHSFLALGRMFGVSDNAVRKWARSYNLL